MTVEIEVDAPFSRVCALTDIGPGRYGGVIGHPWLVGPKPHGGTTVATSAAAATRSLRSAGLTDAFPIAASTDFLGSPEPGDVEYEVRIRKTGRQISIVDVDLVQGDRTLIHTVFTCGRLDDGTPLHAPGHHADMPVEPPADAIPYLGTPLGEIVHLSQGVSMHLDRAGAAFLAGQRGEPRLRLWLRPFAGDEQDPDIAAYIAMMAADASPPVVMNLGHMGWAPTIQLTTYLRRRPAPGWLRIISTTNEVGSRVFDEDHLVLDSTGAIVAQSRQLALVPGN